MAHSSSATSAVTQKNVIGLSVLFLVLAAIFGALNSHKVKALRANVANAEALRRAVESRSVTRQPDPKTKETTATGEQDKVAEAENKAAKAEEELAQLQKEKADLQTRLDANQSEIASLQKRVEEAEKAAKPSETPAGAASAAELQAQLDDARRQLDSAEKRKSLLVRKTSERSRALRSAPGREKAPGNRRPQNRCARHRPCSQSGVQFCCVKSWCSPGGRTEFGNACFAGGHPDRQNSHFFS